VAGINQKNIAFRLRPREYAELEKLSGRNRSELVRKWLTEYIANPTPFPEFDDNLRQVNLAVEPKTQASIAAICTERGVPIMTLVRQIVEHHLRT